MRPRVRSYGESSTATLSPAKIRMKFLRILPETCASTWCLFSSSTRNIAFGSGSITVAMTSMASSFGLPESAFFLSLWGFLEMGRIAAVGGHRGPFVLEHLDSRPTGVDHRLDGQHHAFLQARAVARVAVVGQLRLLVHLRADAVAHKLAHHGKAVLLDPVLHG